MGVLRTQLLLIFVLWRMGELSASMAAGENSLHSIEVCATITPLLFPVFLLCLLDGRVGGMVPFPSISRQRRSTFSSCKAMPMFLHARASGLALGQAMACALIQEIGDAPSSSLERAEPTPARVLAPTTTPFSEPVWWPSSTGGRPMVALLAHAVLHAQATVVRLRCAGGGGWGWAASCACLPSHPLAQPKMPSVRILQRPLQHHAGSGRSNGAELISPACAVDAQGGLLWAVLGLVPLHPPSFHGELGAIAGGDDFSFTANFNDWPGVGHVACVASIRAFHRTAPGASVTWWEPHTTRARHAQTRVSSSIRPQ